MIRDIKSTGSAKWSEFLLGRRDKRELRFDKGGEGNIAIDHSLKKKAKDGANYDRGGYRKIRDIR